MPYPFSTQKRYGLSTATRAVSLALIPLQFFFMRPVAVWAALESQSRAVPTSTSKNSVPPNLEKDPTAGRKVNRTLPQITSPPPLGFSNEPTEEEFARVRLFAEPLVPIGAVPSGNENKALAAAILDFGAKGNAENTQGLSDYISRHPKSPWRAALLANLGAVYRSTGYWSKALEVWEESWSILAGETRPQARALADFVLGELAQLNARLGRQERLEKLFAQIGERDVRGPATEKLAGARQGLALMQERPQAAFRCGPMALERILTATNQNQSANTEIFESRSTAEGMSLTQVHKLASRLGMNYQAAKRSPGARIIYPSVVNWKVGHFAALTKESEGRFLVQDPTFTDDVWVSQKALDEESSGYYLVPTGSLPSGWRPVSAQEADRVWGKGNAGSNSKPPPPCVAPSIKCGTCPDNPGMADYNVDSARVSLSFSDTPVAYVPPKGPAVKFTLNYAQREVAPFSTPTYSNVGNKWSFNLLAYLVVNPANASANAQGYGPGGGTLDYSGFNTTTQSYAAQLQTQVVLVKTGTSSYEKRFPDGSRQVFALSDGASVYPRKIFMTQWIDAHGGSLTYTYDGTFRLVAVSDALGQVTTLSYELASDPLKVTKVTDPFGRFATIEYNAANQLWKITDTVGIVSQFDYGAGDFISKLTTPYGATLFAMGESGATYRWLEITDPLGGKERVEYKNNVATIPASDPANTLPAGMTVFNSWLNYRNTFYWDKKAMAEAPGDYTKARITHWLHTSDVNVAADVVESTKLPLENRVWYSYTGMPNVYTVGTSNKPSHIGRVLDDGTTQLYKYEYNTFGKVTKSTDPVGRITNYVYYPNGIDLFEVRQATGGINELLASYTYNTQHQPLTATDASGQTITTTYNSSGEIHTVTNAKQETTNYGYDADGYLTSITGPVTGATVQFTYDGFGRLRTTTDSEGYTTTIDYDAIANDPTKTLNRVAKVAYPDGTYEQTIYDRLDPEWTRDRLGRWSRKFYDALRRIVATQDPLNQIVFYGWCGCGSLESLTDANGHTTSWSHDIQGRMTDKVYADSTSLHYVYEAKTSRLASIVDAKNQTTNYQYFNDNNLKQITYANAQIATPSVAYTYDPKYNRLATMTDGTGVTTYAYNPVTTPSALGAARLQSIDGPLSGDTINYTYDELGRTNGQSINGTANASSVQYDSLGRVQSVTNPLGAFGYSYVNNTGRIDYVDYPNGQKVQYAYFNNLGDQRLRQIKNLDPADAVISQFDYTYEPIGQIAAWTQASSGMANPQRYALRYDAANQLRSAELTDTVTQAPLNQYEYDYDAAGNRTSDQIASIVSSYVPNNLNQITSRSGGGKMHFRGTVSEPSAVSVGGTPASVDASGNFDGATNVVVGTNTVTVTATDANGNSRTNNYEVTVDSGGSAALVYDQNGNVTNDGSKTYEWDAANRLVAINYTGTSDRSEFSYGGSSHWTKVTEKTGSTITSTKQFIWEGNQIAEERDGSNNVTSRYFTLGEQRIGGADAGLYCYGRDHLGSIRELTDTGGTLRARYDYDPFGNTVKVAGDLTLSFGYTGHYRHAPSNLYLAPYRSYNSTLGRWLNRDRIGEAGGLNLYGYVGNDPVNLVDPTGEFWVVVVVGVLVVALFVQQVLPPPSGKPDAVTQPNCPVRPSEPPPGGEGAPGGPPGGTGNPPPPGNDPPPKGPVESPLQGGNRVPSPVGPYSHTNPGNPNTPLSPSRPGPMRQPRPVPVRVPSR